MIRTLSAFAVACCFLSVPLAAQAAQWEWVGAFDADGFGSSVGAAGDVNADGFDDLIAGAPSTPGGASEPGYARVLSGKDGGQIWRFGTTGAADRFGAAVDGAGDVDDDGFDDLIVGAPGSAPVPGGSCARVYGGADGALLYLLTDTSGDSWSGFGFAVAGLGDLDGDDRDDWAVGAPSLSGEGPGFARVYGGSDGLPRFSVSGLAVGDGFGHAVAPAGDVNADGTPDLIVGAGAGGYARVYSGTDGALLHHLSGPGVGSGFGRAVSAAGDIDADGFADVAVGAPGFHTTDILSGKTGSLLRRFERPGGAFGSSVDVIADLDGDSVPDYLIGAPEDTIGGGAFAGSVFLISGSTGSRLFRFPGGGAGARLGHSVATLGDVDGDGLPDFALGAPGDKDGIAQMAGTTVVQSSRFAGSIVPYGFGCPDSFLITPELELLGDPTGAGALSLIITRGAGGSIALVFFGTDQGFMPLSTGCILWVQPLLPLNLSLTLAGMFPGTGTVTVSGHLPPAVPVGATFTMQSFLPDPFDPGGYSTTNAVAVTKL